MAPPRAGRPGRTLLVLAAVLVALVAAMAITSTWAPRLGLDLRGGASITLQPRAAAGGKVTDAAINQAVGIIRQRVNGQGVAESEVTKQGSGSNATITVSVPGASGRQVLESVGSTAELRFRQVLDAQPAGPASNPLPQPSPSPSASPSATPSAAPASPGRTPTPVATPTPTTNRRVLSGDLLAATPSASPKAAATPAASPRAATPTAPAASPTAPAPAATGSTLTPQLEAQLTALDCTKVTNRSGGSTDLPSQPLVTCDRDGKTKYALAPAEVVGRDIKGAQASLDQTGTGWQVDLQFTGSGSKKWAALTTRVQPLPAPTNQVAIVLDGLVVSAPRIIEPILGGTAQITGSFSQKEARDLADILKYGALPLAFDKGEAQAVSPTLGQDQLNAGLLAGAVGLALVLLYLFLYYRGLGIVAFASLCVASAVTWSIVVLLGKGLGFTLTLAGVAGLIVSIGITADSFIVYFERLRDEVRDGRSLRVAVESGWGRARRTILTADFVSFLAAVVLYFLSIGNVRGFAFTLGLTTLIDVVVVFLFTHPMVSLLAGTEFFGNGHRMSGLDPQRLGRREPPAPVVARRPAPTTGSEL